ncbi:hypothetical protein AAFF_G00329540 [Aldrovandia affinis]|uniref:Uncharacterized protein n=1 Tax=Aldrovandia affinis TaxID=143900 RepID=A0AAD7SMP9_9TELE|nr:hypothetical protein AAFF_G00329540 [Aldrovandia affinis]
MEDLGDAYPLETTPPFNISHALPAVNESCEDLGCYMVLTEAEKTAIGSICFLAGPITFLENALVLGLIGNTPSLRRRPSYLFIGSLALADVFASCFFTSSFLDFHLFHRKAPESNSEERIGRGKLCAPRLLSQQKKGCTCCILGHVQSLPDNLHS